MSANPRIDKLEALLTRIQTRASEPRRVRGVVATALAAHAAAAPAATGSAPRIATPPPMRKPMTSEAEVTVGTEEYIDEVEVSSEVVEVDIDEPGMESMRETAESEAAAAAAAEEAPVSSKRPIAEEEDAAADREAPLHTPPPESGRQVAASPAAPPESARRPSAPPDPGGGWREPGLSEPKKQPSLAPPAPAPIPAAASRMAPPPPSIPRPATTGPISQSPFSQPPMSQQGQSVAGQPAQVMRPQIAHSEEVAKIEGSVQQAEASSFGDILDGSLSI